MRLKYTSPKSRLLQVLQAWISSKRLTILADQFLFNTKRRQAAQFFLWFLQTLLNLRPNRHLFLVYLLFLFLKLYQLLLYLRTIFNISNNIFSILLKLHWLFYIDFFFYFPLNRYQKKKEKRITTNKSSFKQTFRVCVVLQKLINSVWSVCNRYYFF